MLSLLFFSFSQLIDDKKALSEKCERVVKELKQVDKKYADKIKTMQDRYLQMASFLNNALIHESNMTEYSTDN